MNKAKMRTAASTETELPLELQCPKCGRTTPSQEPFCRHCRRHLYVACPRCGEVNFRGNERCVECNVSLHKSRVPVAPASHQLVWPVCWASPASRWWVVPIQVLVFIVAVAAGSYGAFRLAQWEGLIPQPQIYILQDGQTIPTSPQPIKK